MKTYILDGLVLLVIAAAYKWFGLPGAQATVAAAFVGRLAWKHLQDDAKHDVVAERLSSAITEIQTAGGLNTESLRKSVEASGRITNLLVQSEVGKSLKK